MKEITTIQLRDIIMEKIKDYWDEDNFYSKCAKKELSKIVDDRRVYTMEEVKEEVDRWESLFKKTKEKEELEYKNKIHSRFEILDI